MKTSQKWQLNFETERGTEIPPSQEVASEWIRTLSEGIVDGVGDQGDSFRLQLDRSNGLVLYMTPSQEIYRPEFPISAVTGSEIEEFYCECCGVQIGDRSELIARCTSRPRAIAIVADVLNGKLPVSSEIRWVPLVPRRPAHHG